MDGFYAEYDVLKAFKYYCSHNNQAAFIFSNFVWLNTDRKEVAGESDILMVHKKIGIILVETKTTAKHASDVYRQLDKAQAKLLELNSEITKCMCDYCRELKVTLSESHFKKVRALPNTHVNDTKCDHNNSVYFQLGCNHLKSYDLFNGWWIDMMNNSSDNDVASIYHKIIPKMFMELLK